MRGGVMSPAGGWAVFETVQPGVEMLMFAGGLPYEARSALRVLGKQVGALYLGVARRVAGSGVDVRETLADGRVVVGEAVKGPAGAVHAGVARRRRTTAAAGDCLLGRELRDPHEQRRRRSCRGVG